MFQKVLRALRLKPKKDKRSKQVNQTEPPKPQQSPELVIPTNIPKPTVGQPEVKNSDASITSEQPPMGPRDIQEPVIQTHVEKHSKVHIQHPCPPYAVKSVMGQRGTMEDSWQVVPDLLELPSQWPKVAPTDNLPDLSFHRQLGDVQRRDPLDLHRDSGNSSSSTRGSTDDQTHAVARRDLVSTPLLSDAPSVQLSSSINSQVDDKVRPADISPNKEVRGADSSVNSFTGGAHHHEPHVDSCEPRDLDSHGGSRISVDVDVSVNPPLPHKVSPKAASLTPPSSSRATYHFFAVFDGHGGASVAKHCAKTLHEYLCSVVSQSTGEAPSVPLAGSFSAAESSAFSSTTLTSTAGFAIVEEGDVKSEMTTTTVDGVVLKGLEERRLSSSGRCGVSSLTCANINRTAIAAAEPASAPSTTTEQSLGTAVLEHAGNNGQSQTAGVDCSDCKGAHCESANGNAMGRNDNSSGGEATSNPQSAGRFLGQLYMQHKTIPNPDRGRDPGLDGILYSDRVSSPSCSSKLRTICDDAQKKNDEEERSGNLMGSGGCAVDTADRGVVAGTTSTRVDVQTSSLSRPGAVASYGRCGSPHAGCPGVTPAVAPLSGPVASLEEALKEAFKAVDNELVERQAAKEVGTTAVVAMLGSESIYVANCGDSRALLCREDEALSLSLDHKATRADEMLRVEAAGGYVWWDRVMGELAVSRAIGDHGLHPFVISEPEVTSVVRRPADVLLVMASDGLWDVFSNEDVRQLALSKFHGELGRSGSSRMAVKRAASSLVKAALVRGTRDNVTVIVVDCRPFFSTSRWQAAAAGAPVVGSDRRRRSVVDVGVGVVSGGNNTVLHHSS